MNSPKTPKWDPIGFDPQPCVLPRAGSSGCAFWRGWLGRHERLAAATAAAPPGCAACRSSQAKSGWCLASDATCRAFSSRVSYVGHFFLDPNPDVDTDPMFVGPNIFQILEATELSIDTSGRLIPRSPAPATRLKLGCLERERSGSPKASRRCGRSAAWPGSAVDISEPFEPRRDMAMGQNQKPNRAPRD